VSFAAITLCVASQRVFIVVRVYFVIDLVRRLLDTPSHCLWEPSDLGSSAFNEERSRYECSVGGKMDDFARVTEPAT
jgi:hypothetical protein